MKVLFAVSNENISESIVKKYQKQYKEIVSYKNVYYFNAILKEIQKDKSYDRIVISEDLEPFTNNNYDQIDKFLFDKLDSISDEATNNTRTDTPIILICSDRRNKGENFLVKLFSIGIYDAIIGQDRSIDEICSLIKTPRNKKEAKAYYQIESESANYQPENENDVSEVEIQNILTHYKKLGKDENAYVKSFDEIASQYNDIQLKMITSFLPLNVKAVLEGKSPKYQKLMMTGRGNYVPVRPIKSVAEKSGIQEKLIKSKTGASTLSKPVIVPTAVDTTKVKKIKQKIQEEEEEERIQIEEQNNRIEEKPKKRGRPRKNPLPVEQEEIQEEKEGLEEKPKRRGRPRKNPLPNEVQPQEEKEDYEILPGLEDEEEDVAPISDSYNTLPGLDDEEEQEEISVLPGLEDDEDQEDYNPEPEMQYGGISSHTNYSEPKREAIRPIRPTENLKNSFQYENNEQEKTITNRQNSYFGEPSVDSLLTREKKLVSFVGTSKNGTSFLINNLAQFTSSIGINTAILDATKNRNAYYIYTKNEEALRQTAAGTIPNLRKGMAQGIKVNKNLSVYTSIPDEDVGIEDYREILATLVQNHSLILIDCDFNTNIGYFGEAQEIYLVQSMDVLTIQPLTAFLRDLKTKNALREQSIRIVINQEMKVRGLTPKAIIGGMSYYNDPAMSYMTELFNRDMVKYCTIPFDQLVYARYLEGLAVCEISTNGYPKVFMQQLRELANMVYPLIGSRQNYKPVEDYSKSKFSNDMNHTLNQMRRNY